MMLLGKALFKCPIDGKEVTLDKDCIHCKYFKHWGIKGAKPYVSCNPTLVPPTEEKTEVKEV